MYFIFEQIKKIKANKLGLSNRLSLQYPLPFALCLFQVEADREQFLRFASNGQ